MINNTIIIMDWDDTLFPTSWIGKKEIDLTSIHDVNKYSFLFIELDSLISKIISKLKMYGKPIIITNATLKWIGICINVLPKTKNIIKNINIVSARDRYQNKFNDPTLWKKETFKDVHKFHFPDNRFNQNIISIGDADYEHKALIELYGINYMGKKHKYLKSIRMIRYPDFKNLMTQLNKLYINIDFICKSKKHIELEFKNLI